MQKADRIIAIILIMLGVLWIYETKRFNSVLSFREVGQNVIPMIAGIGLIICGICMIIMFCAAKDKNSGEAEKPFTREIFIRTGILLAMMAVYIAVTPLIGFTLASFLFIIIFLLSQEYTWWKSVLLSCGVVLVYVVVFQNYLSMSLPIGWWGF